MGCNASSTRIHVHFAVAWGSTPTVGIHSFGSSSAEDDATAAGADRPCTAATTATAASGTTPAPCASPSTRWDASCWVLQDDGILVYDAAAAKRLRAQSLQTRQQLQLQPCFSWSSMPSPAGSQAQFWPNTPGLMSQPSCQHTAGDDEHEDVRDVDHDHDADRHPMTITDVAQLDFPTLAKLHDLPVTDSSSSLISLPTF